MYAPSRGGSARGGSFASMNTCANAVPFRAATRSTMAPHASALTRLFNLLVMEPGSLVMERRMLLGIKERAQRLAGGLGQADPAAPART